MSEVGGNVRSRKRGHAISERKGKFTRVSQRLGVGAYETERFELFYFIFPAENSELAGWTRPEKAFPR